MTGKTHRAGGFLCSVVGFALLRENGLLLKDVNEGLQWLIMYPFCMWGSVASDLDHHWQSSPMKDPPSYICNKLLHPTEPLQKILEKGGDTKSGLYKFASLFNASHRSWQTHSDLTLFIMIMVSYLAIHNQYGLGLIDSLLLRMIVLGVSLGVIAHFILDMLTTAGITSVVLCTVKFILRKVNPRIKNFPTKIGLVPHWKCFATSGSWELWINKLLKVLNILAMIYLLWSILGLGVYFPYDITITL